MGKPMNANEIYFNLANLELCFRESLGISDDRQLRWSIITANLKIGMFTYENLPVKGLDSRILETALYFYPRLCFYYVKGIQEWKLGRYTVSNSFDDLMLPKTVNIYGFNGSYIANDVPYEDIIPVYDNCLMIAPYFIINSDINMITDIENTIRQEINILSFPAMVTGNKKNVAQLKELCRKAKLKEPFILSDTFDSSVLDYKQVSFETTPSDLFELLERYKNLLLSSIGIYGADKKRERLITAEINSENDQTDFVYQSMLNCRNEFVKKLNERGCNVKLIETYVQNAKGDAELEIEKETQLAMADAKADMQVEEVKNEGKVDVAKIEAQAMKEGGANNGKL